MFPLSCSKLFALLQMGDSAFPIGGFSFSAGLEGAVAEGMVTTIEELADYTRTVVCAAARLDAIAALEAFRAIGQSHLSRLGEIDHRVLEMKLPPESRTQTLRMGARLCSLLRAISPSPLVGRWGQMVDQAEGVVTLPVAQAVGAALFDVGEQGLFAAHLYGSASVVLNASLRLMRVSHYDTQRILLSLGPLVERLYERYGSEQLDSMSAFTPLVDIAASLHERGRGRLFMN